MSKKQGYNALLELVAYHYTTDPRHEELKLKLINLRNKVESFTWEDEFESMVGLTIIGPDKFRLFVNIDKESYMAWFKEYMNV